MASTEETLGRWLLVAALCAVGPACGPRSTEGADAADDTDGDDDDDDVADTGDDDDDDGDETTGGEVDGPGLADGIRITLVEANQGVGIAIADAEGWIGPEDRNARLMRDRPLLVRVVHDVDDGWEPREIEAVLEVGDGDGVTEHRVTMMVGGAPDPDDLGTQFSFRLERDEVTPGLTFRVRLFETEDGRGADDNAEAVAPAEPLEIGIEDVTASLEVVLVSGSVEGCPAPPEDLEPFAERARQALMELHPLQDVSVRVREEAISAEATDDCEFPFELSAALFAAREADGEDPNTMYIAVYGSVLGEACQALGIGERVFMASTTGDLDEFGARIDHCGGLSLGHRHVRCTGEEAGPDPDYPYPDGDVGGYGWSVETEQFHTPSAKSYLSFCEEPTWVSDWSWDKSWGFLQEG